MRFNLCPLTVALCATCALTASEPKPNIVLVMTDDQGIADIGINRAMNPQGANLQTPELDRMAGESLWFNRAYAAAPVCSPTRGSVLTGRHPFRYGVWKFGVPIRAQERLLSQDLAEAGYATGHFGKWHLDGRDGPGKPLAVADPLGPAALGFQTYFSVSNFFDLDTTFGTTKGPIATTGDGSEAVVAQANTFIAASVAAKRPFFAVVWFGSPHVPLKPLPADQLACGGNAKFGELLGVDRAVGHLRSELSRLGVAKDTVLWFTSDNGSADHGGCGPLRGSKGDVYEGGLRVPGMLCWPGTVKPGRSDVPVVTTDIRLTVLAITGVKPSRTTQPQDGIDLTPLLRGAMPTRPQPICFWFARELQKNQQTTPSPNTGDAAILDNTWKLFRSGDTWALYDLAADPQEKTNVAATQGAIAARLRQQLETWQTSVAASCDGKDYPEGLQAKPGKREEGKK
ncbi:MAG: sulfatase-like hydrolase/transferase [Planctomycetota bacterium]